ncbi:MAG: LytTR family transcriptional regulator DNA-binding domain-containing protein [Firmicutes bacterium]|nr:LytTR family transcriptional regulator DNA-binding domain-containing protein [Bacillota bacterium]
MKIRTEISSKYAEIELHICHNEINDEVRNISSELHMMYDESLTGTDERGNRRLLRPGEITAFYSEGQRVIALGEKERYMISNKLYELEESLTKTHFIRISKSEIVNIRKIRSLDMSLSGTIRILMKNGHEAYVSRRNVSKLKERLKAERMVKQA